MDTSSASRSLGTFPKGKAKGVAKLRYSRGRYETVQIIGFYRPIICAVLI